MSPYILASEYSKVGQFPQNASTARDMLNSWQLLCPSMTSFMATFIMKKLLLW